MLYSIGNRIWILSMEEETDRPNLGYIQGSKDSLFIDVGNSPRHMEKMMQALNVQNLPLPTMAVLTHWHWDHTFGLCAFEGISFSTKETARQLSLMQSWKWDHQSMRNRLKSGEEIFFCHHHMRMEYENTENIQIKLPTVTFEKRLEINLGDRTVELEKIGGPHSEDSLWAYLPEEKVLFAGDADSGDYYGLEGQYDSMKLRKYIERLEEKDFELYIHGHRPILKKKEILKELYLALNHMK